MSRESSSWQDLLDSFTKSGFQKGKANVIHQIRNENAARVQKILEDDELWYLPFSYFLYITVIPLLNILAGF